MHESIFSSKVTLSTQTTLATAKVDIVKYETYIEVRLIDTSNIFSLYICTISQSDFYVLKKDQDILVDYDRFINILVGLFHSLSTGKLTGVFDDGRLRFIENGEFRNICKLELKFTKPEEVQYKRYLGDLLSRMENDNIKLIKENSLLRDKCVNGDRELREKVRYLEGEMQEYRRKYELAMRDNATLEARGGGREEEISRLSSRVFSLEGENCELKNDLQAYKKEDIHGLRDQLVAMEREVRETKREIDTANGIIRKLREELEEAKGSKSSHVGELQREKDKNVELTAQINNLTKKCKTLEEKYKSYREESKMKGNKVKELENECKTLRKNLDNTRYVNNFLYEQKIGDHIDNYSDSLNIRPEPPLPEK